VLLKVTGLGSDPPDSDIQSCCYEFFLSPLPDHLIYRLPIITVAMTATVQDTDFVHKEVLEEP
jgi:hypothetical protein